MLRSKHVIYIIGTSTFLLFGGFIKYYLYRKRKALRQSYPKDIVILHQFPDGFRAPSASPFCLKIETWLRMVDIKYQVNSTNLIVYNHFILLT